MRHTGIPIGMCVRLHTGGSEGQGGGAAGGHQDPRCRGCLRRQGLGDPGERQVRVFHAFLPGMAVDHRHRQRHLPLYVPLRRENRGRHAGLASDPVFWDLLGNWAGHALHGPAHNMLARHRVSVGGGRLTLRREMLGRVSEKSLSCAGITTLEQREFYKQNDQPVYGIEIKGAEGKIRFGTKLEEAEKAWLVVELTEAALPNRLPMPP